jgi:hypothetical protein
MSTKEVLLDIIKHLKPSSEAAALTLNSKVLLVDGL